MKWLNNIWVALIITALFLALCWYSRPYQETGYTLDQVAAVNALVDSCARRDKGVIFVPKNMIDIDAETYLFGEKRL